MSLFWRTVIATVGPRSFLFDLPLQVVRCQDGRGTGVHRHNLTSAAHPYVGSDGPRSINNGPAVSNDSVLGYG